MCHSDVGDMYIDHLLFSLVESCMHRGEERQCRALLQMTGGASMLSQSVV